jgi:hypothetical protein
MVKNYKEDPYQKQRDYWLNRAADFEHQLTAALGREKKLREALEVLESDSWWYVPTRINSGVQEYDTKTVHAAQELAREALAENEKERG